MKYSFRDCQTQVLKAYGYCEQNQISDIRQEEDNDFLLEPGEWVYANDEWIPITEVQRADFH